jgi:23S rRNA (cytosine1962-C5)-methyltransferase
MDVRPKLYYTAQLRRNFRRHLLRYLIRNHFMLIITIKQGKEKSLLEERQPWVYASAVERVDGRPQEKMTAGITALVHSSSGQFIARAAYNSKSQIRARIWSFDANEPVDHALIKRRVKVAVAKRSGATTKPVVLVSGDEDGLSGLLVEWYGGIKGYLVCEFQAAGVDAWKVPIVQSLMAETGCKNVYERADALLRKGEGLAVLSGVLAGDEPPDAIELTEKGVKFFIDIKTGRKDKFR